jgi:large subunit ribosomal protein L25
MAEVVLAAETGRPLGSRAVRRLRREGKVPGVIYGHGTEPLPVAVGARELRVALNGEAGANQLLSLDTGSGSYLTLAREMQRHPVAQTVTHVDFVIVRRDEVISADVPITLVGEATEVHHGDGLVEQQMFTLAINALPANIPSGLEADITELTIGGQVRVSDLVLPEGVTTDVEPETAVAIGQPPRVVVLEEEAEVAEGEGEGEEAAAAPAEAAAATSEAAEAASAEEG